MRHTGPSSFSGPIISAGSLPILPFTPNRALTNSASAVTLSSAGGPHNLAAGAYQDVRFNDNTVVNLGAGVYDMRNLSMGKHVTINVLDTTILQIDRQFDPNDFLMFGTNAEHHGGAHVYVGGFGDNVSTTRSTNFSHNAVIHMQYFSPTAWLDLGGGNELYGHYWADRITGDPNNNVTMEIPAPPVLWVLAGAGLVASRRRRN